MKYIEFIVERQEKDALSKSCLWNSLKQCEREYTQIKFNEINQNAYQEGLSKGMITAFSSEKYLITSYNHSLPYLAEIKANAVEGRMAMRSDIDGQLYSLIRSQDNNKLFIINGVDNDELADYLEFSVLETAYIISYRLAAIHTFITIQDKKTGEYIMKLGFNPAEYKALLGKLDIRDENIYDEIYFRGNDYYQGPSGMYDTGSYSIDRYITKAQFEYVTSYMRTIKNFLNEPDSIKLSNNNSFDNLKHYLFNPEISPVPDLVNNKVYFVLANNCNLIVSNVLHKAKIFTKDDHPFLYHQYDKLNLNDGGVLHNMFVNLPPTYTYLNSLFMSRAMGWLKEKIADNHYPISISSNTDTQFMLALKSGNLAKAAKYLELAASKIANTVDHLGMVPLHYVYCIITKDEQSTNLKQDIINGLLAHTFKQNINKLDDTKNFFPLDYASNCGTYDDMKNLLDNGAKADLNNNRGNVVHEIIINKYPEHDEKLALLMEYAPGVFAERNKQMQNKTALEMLNCTTIDECESKLTNDDPYDAHFSVPHSLHSWSD